jgi:ABC1 atypical kinase-like domain
MQQVERNLSPMLPKNSNSNEETKGAEGERVAGDELEELSIDVSLPQVIQEYVTEKLLVMSYIDGFKVNLVCLSPFF